MFAFVKRRQHGVRKTHGIQGQRKSQEDDMHGAHYSTWFAALSVCDIPRDA
jgi:hypothetical protein